MANRRKHTSEHKVAILTEWLDRNSRNSGLYGGRDRLLRVSDVAEQLGVSTATVYKLCQRGELPHVRIIDSIRIRPGNLAEFLARRL